MGHPPSLGLLLPLRCHGSAPFSTALLSCSPCRTASPAQDESHTRRNGFPVTIPLAIVGNEGTVALEVSAEFLHSFFEAWQAGVGGGKVIKAPSKISKAAQSL